MTELDPLLREAMTRVRGPVNARPSLTDVRRRARRRNRRRMSATVGVVACAGVGTTALIIRRDAAGRSGAAPGSETTFPANTPTTLYVPETGGSTTTILGIPEVTVTPGMVWDALWNARTDPAGASLNIEPADQAAAGVMPTPEQFGCTSEECRAMFTYVVWHEIARTLGFENVYLMQTANAQVNFAIPPVDGQELFTAYPGDPGQPSVNGDTTTTFAIFEGIMLIDGGAPAGAMEDAYQRLAGYDRTIVPGTGKQIEQTEVMPIGDNTSMAGPVGALLGIDGFDTWDPSFVASPMQGMVAVVIGPDYWDRVQQAATASTTTTSSTVVTTTSAAP